MTYDHTFYDWKCPNCGLHQMVKIKKRPKPIVCECEVAMVYDGNTKKRVRR
jgi:hypothetical protein